MMVTFSTIQLIVSIVVVAVAAITAIISYLNFRAITEVTIYINTKTEFGVFEQNNYSQYPDRINVTLHKNGMTVPPPYPMPIRWFDIYLGNTGPGIALIEHWKVDYDPKARDTSEMENATRLTLGPQSLVNIVGLLPRDYSSTRAGSPGILYPLMKNLPNSAGAFPWKIEVIYRKKVIKFSKEKYKMEFEVDSKGSVRSSGPVTIQS